MKKKVVILGADDKFLIYLTKYLILNNIDAYLVLTKAYDEEILKEIGNKISIVRWDGNIEHLKLLFKSIEPDVVYNLANKYKNNECEDIREILERNYTYVIEILESLTVYNKAIFVNLVSEYKLDGKECSEDLYSIIIKSMEVVSGYYEKKYGIKTIYKERKGDLEIDLDNLLVHV